MAAASHVVFDSAKTKTKLKELRPIVSDTGYRDVLIGALGDYATAREGHAINTQVFDISGSGAGEPYVSNRFRATNMIAPPSMLTGRELAMITKHLGSRVNGSITRDKELTKAGAYVTISPLQNPDSGMTRIFIGATIEPLPENFDAYLPAVDLFLDTSKWFDAATDEACRRIDKEFEDIVAKARDKLHPDDGDWRPL
ncbi:MAG: hypothetical protein HYS81_05285 [Candidatus Aenigmatarchaeota archaeon]|nr:MAG: hypothetical protein HYS81_05285 [Candidatus Aenigmarchaeota archaeon]